MSVPPSDSQLTGVPPVDATVSAVQTAVRNEAEAIHKAAQSRLTLARADAVKIIAEAQADADRLIARAHSEVARVIGATETRTQRLVRLGAFFVAGAVVGALLVYFG